MFVVVFGGVRACVYQLAGALFFFIIFKKKILYMVTFYCNHTRALTFQIFFLAAVEISRPKNSVTLRVHTSEFNTPNVSE